MDFAVVTQPTARLLSALELLRFVPRTTCKPEVEHGSQQSGFGLRLRATPAPIFSSFPINGDQRWSCVWSRAEGSAPGR